MPLKPLALDMRTLLPKLRAAYNAKQLQSQKIRKRTVNVTCRYAGPCAIGVGIPEAKRARFDTDNDSTFIGDLINNGRIVVPDHQRSDFLRLQMAHDAAATGGSTNRELNALIRDLEAKYVAV